MDFVERTRNVLAVFPEKCGRWYGPGCALAGASIVWTFAVGFSRPKDESPAPSGMVAIVESDAQPLEFSPAESSQGLTQEFMLGSGVHCKAGELPVLATDTLLGDAFCPLHERADYRVESPDILRIDFQADDASWEGMSGEYLVNADGAVKLGGDLGSVNVAGLTLEEIQSAIAGRLQCGGDSPRVLATVLAQNSHVYYVFHGNSQNAGDYVSRISVIGNETVLDAVRQACDLGELDDKNIFIARPQAGERCDTILPVQWREISSDPASAANYQVLAGDRIFVAESASSVLETAIGQWLEPFRQLLGQGESTSDACCPLGADCCQEGCCRKDRCQENCCPEAEDEY